LTVTATVPLPPACVGEIAFGEIVESHTTPACVMPNDCPATVMVAVRCVVVGLAVMLYPTLPLPDPLAPLVIDTQAASSTAVQAQPVGIDTAIEPVVEAEEIDTPVGAIVAVHGTPAWVTANACPAMVTTPLRGDVLVFAAML
jgi:hypothetical protein